MHRILTVTIVLVFLYLNLAAQNKSNKDFSIPFENDKNYSSTYAEVIDFCKRLDRGYTEVSYREFGNTDIGKPLPVLIISKDGVVDPDMIRASGRIIMFVNNAIHPGEPCGIEATMLFARDLVQKKEWRGVLDKIVFIAIPMYNIDGVLNRGKYSRANQNGPAEYGFRGNAQNLDLNRDFIKCDSENAATFNQMYSVWRPDVFIDTHTSNGADYTYTMTMLPTESTKLGPHLGKLLKDEMMPELYQKMAEKDWEMCPYVVSYDTPENGIMAFNETPRYSSGYAALFQALSFVPEAHMLKSYEDRVYSTYAFFESVMEYMNENSESIKKVRKDELSYVMSADSLPMNTIHKSSEFRMIPFKGYKAKLKPSLVTGRNRLYYDRDEIWEQEIKFFDSYENTDFVKKPKAYIVPQAYKKVIERLEWNRVEMQRFEQDSTVEVEAYYILDYKTGNSVYEGHYLHSDVKVEAKQVPVQVFEGDYIINSDQENIRYIMEVLEPIAVDSYFNWNFFDGVLMQKEWYSDYVFEDLAAKLLEEDEALRERFEAMRAADPTFSRDSRAQLMWIYRNSPYYEKSHMRYPVYRVM